MKAFYKTPTTMVMHIETENLLKGVSGLGLQQGGQATSTVVPQ